MQQAHMQPQNEPQAEAKKNCLTDLTLPKLTDYIKSIGQPAFRAKQIFKWIHQKQATDFSAMTDQPKALLAQFAQNCTLAVPTIRRRQQSKDGTVKYLLQLADGNCIETVLMRYHYGNTVCVSTQVGCAMGCRFCASTQAGRVRDLTSGEIAAEIYTAQKDTGERVSHIVLMGIGEPLHNFDNVMDFLDIISCPEGVNIGMRNISLSTCGLVPGIDKLAERKLQLTLSVSLHAPDNVTRSSMMPVNDAFPLEKLIPACDISEQISLASKEASGTGNMKFMLNGALTLGTMDGANVEIAELVGNENIFTFGEDSQTVIDRYARGDYNSRSYYEKDSELKRAVDFIVSDTVKSVGCSENLERLYNELLNKDWFMTFPDFEDYIATREKAYAAYTDRKDWAKKALINISKAGFFSSDRTIDQYNKEIWKLS